VAEIEQHLTIEQLSALLDGQLSQSEQEYAQEHLPTCEQCQQQQAELRQTVEFLHALPQPALPRSFVLPLDTVFAEPVPVVAPGKKPYHLPTKATSSTQQTFWPSYLRTTIRVVSTLAAVVGIVFLLSSLLPTFVSHTSEGNTASTASMAVPPTNALPKDVSVTQETISPHTAPARTPLSTQPQATSAQIQGTPIQFRATPGQSYRPMQSSTRPVDTSPSITTVFDLSTLQGRTTLGFLLLVLGILGLMVFRRPKPVS
jgi:anti-sigma factor RsiW